MEYFSPSLDSAVYKKEEIEEEERAGETNRKALQVRLEGNHVA